MVLINKTLKKIARSAVIYISISYIPTLILGPTVAFILTGLIQIIRSDACAGTQDGKGLRCGRRINYSG